MKLTILGNNGAVPRAGGACSGYLLREGDTNLMLDCGSGAFSNLVRHVHPFDLSAVVISHMHADHFFDLVPLRYALLLSFSGRRSEPLPLWLPSGCAQVLENFAASFGGGPHYFGEVFALREYNPGDEVQVGPLRLTFVAMTHFIPSFGVRVAAEDTFAYSGDTAYGDKALALAAGVDTFLCEATMQEATYERSRAGHLSAADAGRLATRAGARRLLLTHIWHELDPRVSLEEARTTFAGSLDLAEEGATYDVVPKGN
ncbi:MAG: MBL fold metallo-hydrolase [Chloroflexota bacterium]